MLSQTESLAVIRRLLLLYLTSTSLLVISQSFTSAKAIDLLDASQLIEYSPNYCNDSTLIESAGLIRSTLGQFLGFECSAEFFHCRWQSDGFRTYKKICLPGLVYDTLGTQNCNYDYNVKGCAMQAFSENSCTAEQFLCPLSEMCVNMSQRCDGKYDCVLEEDEQNCPICEPAYFPCVASEQCIPMRRRCDGFPDCSDHTDEMNCEECPAGSFYCRKSNQCIDASQRCDGIVQCLSADDEALCKVPREREFVCEDRNHKIPMIQMCDGINQCPDKSDEAYCYRNIDYPLSYSQRTNPNPPYFSLGHKEAPENGKNEGKEIQEKRTDITEKILDYEVEMTTMKPLTTAREILKNASNKSSVKPFFSSTTTDETRRSHKLRTTTATESTNIYGDEIITEERTLMQTDGNYENEVIAITVPSLTQQTDEAKSYELTSKNVMFPLFLVHNKFVTPRELKTTLIKTNPIQYITPIEKITPRTEVVHSADHFPFLQKSPYQKITPLPESSQLIDLTSVRPNEDSFSSKRVTVKKKQNLPIEEITVPLHERTLTAPIAESVNVSSTKTKFVNLAALTTSSRRSPSSKTSKQTELSSTKRPKNPNVKKRIDTPEAVILERISTHFKTEKGGRTLSPRDLLDKIELLLNKEASLFKKFNKEESEHYKNDISSAKPHYPTSSKNSNHRYVSYGVTKRPTTKWHPSLSSSPVRMFTSRIVRTTTRIPMMTYEDVQMRHSDAIYDDVQHQIEPQSVSLYSRTSVQEVTTVQKHPSIANRNSRSTTKLSKTKSLDSYSQLQTAKQKSRIPLTMQGSMPAKSTVTVLLSNILDEDDQYGA